MEPDQRLELDQQGFLVFDVVSVMSTHLTEVIRLWACEILTLESVQDLLAKPAHARLMNLLGRAGHDDVSIWKLMRQLLQERVSIRDVTQILQTLLLDTESSDPPLELVRRGLAKQITGELVGDDGKLLAVVLTPEQEQALTAEDLTVCSATAQQLFDYCQRNGHPRVFLCQPAIRRKVKERLRPQLPEVHVLSWLEVPPGLEVRRI